MDADDCTSEAGQRRNDIAGAEPSDEAIAIAE
jgi:hypothetical protein